MEASATLRSTPCLLALSNLTAHRSKTYVSVGFVKGFRSMATYHRCHRRANQLRRTGIVAAASSSSNPSEDENPIAPLEWESGAGKFLSEILVSHPHLLPAAADQQLEQLQIDRDANMNPGEPSSPSTDLVLYRRIAELKANERGRALEEILYALVVGKFIDANVSLVPSIGRLTDPAGMAGKWKEEENLERLHSLEAYEMIKNHLSLILGQQPEDSGVAMQTSKLRVGQVYAASVMYGYFLRRVDERFQLEKSMKTLPWGSDVVEDTVKQQIMPDESWPSPQADSSHPEVSSWSTSFGDGGFADRIKPCKLRSYVMSFDSETLRRYSSVRSKEAFSIIEKHTEALFGRPEIIITPQGTIDSSRDELIKISRAGLKRLILEAVTFGSFLWDVESHVDSRYHFVTN